MEINEITQVFAAFDRHGIKAKQLSNLTGVSISTVYRWKSNPTTIEDSSKRLIFILAKVLESEDEETVAALKHAADYDTGTLALMLFLVTHHMKAGIHSAGLRLLKKSVNGSVP